MNRRFSLYRAAGFILVLVAICAACYTRNVRPPERMDPEEAASPSTEESAEPAPTRVGGVPVTPNATPAVVPSAPPIERDPEERGPYRLGAGDKIAVNVWNENSLNREIEITADEFYNFPLIGEIRLRGQTIDEVQQELTERLGADYLIDPRVDVRIVEYGSKKVRIFGKVRSPGIYTMEQNWVDLLEVIAMAKGLDAAYGTNAFIYRPKDPDPHSFTDTESGDVETTWVNLKELYERGGIEQNIRIHPYDTIHISDRRTESVRENTIWILGQVRSPGEYEYRQGLTVLAAVTAAGGPTALASPERGTILRRTEDGRQVVIDIDLQDIQDGRAEDWPLQPGDMINLPESWF